MSSLIERKSRLRKLTDRRLFISCLVPVHNEESTIVSFLSALHKQLAVLTTQFEILVIDDGSSDDTVEAILSIIETHSIKLLKFSRNFGKEIALTAGLEYSSGEVVIPIDADFQHPMETIPIFLQKWSQGYDIVYGIRKHRSDEVWLKRLFSNLFYGLLSKITKVKIPNGAGDFRLFDRKVVNALNQFEERGRFMKGLYAWVGFKSTAVPFDVCQRVSGQTRWKLSSLTELALTGITLFSDVPLRVWSFIGLLVSLSALVYALYIVGYTLVTGGDVPGFATIIVAILFLGGIQLFSVGILGEYLARVFNEVKRRPKYILEDTYGFDDVSPSSGGEQQVVSNSSH